MIVTALTVVSDRLHGSLRHALGERDRVNRDIVICDDVLGSRYRIDAGVAVSVGQDHDCFGGERTGERTGDDWIHS